MRLPRSSRLFHKTFPFDVHAYVNTLATEPDDSRISEEAIDELLNLPAGDGSNALNADETQ